MELYDKDASLSTKSQAVINHINGRTLAYVRSVTHKRNELKAENKRQSSKANHCIPPAWTKKKWRTMKRALFTLDVESTSGIPYSFTFRPVKGTTPEKFNKALKALTRWLTSKGNQWVYVMEWAQHQSEPHVHAIIMVNERSINGQAGKIVSKWVTLANNAIPSNIPPQWDLDLKGQQYSEPTRCIGKQIDYMAKPETKLNDFNREASKSLYDWSDANVWGYSNGWARHEIKKETLSITGFHAVRRILKAIQASRKDNYKVKRQIQRTLKRQDINRSPITPFQAPLISKHDWDLSVIAVTKEAETERRELLSSQTINSNKVQTHPLLRMLRKARVRASRARRESGGYDHYY